MIYGFLLVIHVIVSVLLVVTILMQASKGGGLAGIASGMASSPVFGGRQAATLLHKVTIGLALLFGVNCIVLSSLSKGRSAQRSVTQQQMQEEAASNPLGFLDEGATGVDTAEELPAMPGEIPGETQE